MNWHNCSFIFSCNTEDSNDLHKKEVTDALEEAKRQYKLDHPDAADLKLQHDPQKFIAELPTRDMVSDDEDVSSNDDDNVDYNIDYGFFY